MARSRVSVPWTTSSASSVRTRVRRSSGAATVVPSKASSSGPRTEISSCRVGRAGRWASRSPAARPTAPGSSCEMAQLGPRRLRDLVHQPLGQPRAVLMVGGVQSGGELDRPRQREGGEHLRGVESGRVRPAIRRGGRRASGSSPCVCSCVGPIVALVPPAANVGVRARRRGQEPSQVLVQDRAGGMGGRHVGDQLRRGGLVVIDDGAQALWPPRRGRRRARRAARPATELPSTRRCTSSRRPVDASMDATRVRRTNSSREVTAGMSTDVRPRVEQLARARPTSSARSPTSNAWRDPRLTASSCRVTSTASSARPLSNRQWTRSRLTELLIAGATRSSGAPRSSSRARSTSPLISAPMAAMARSATSIVGVLA